jgi:hypothetical protein
VRDVREHHRTTLPRLMSSGVRTGVDLQAAIDAITVMKVSPPGTPDDGRARRYVRRSQLQGRKRGQQRGDDRAEQQRAQPVADRNQRDEQRGDGQALRVRRSSYSPSR